MRITGDDLLAGAKNLVTSSAPKTNAHVGLESIAADDSCVAHEGQPCPGPMTRPASQVRASPRYRLITTVLPLAFILLSAANGPQ